MYVKPCLLGTAFTGYAFGNLLVAESQLLPSMRVDGNFHRQHWLTLPAKYERGAFSLGALNSCITSLFPVPDLSGTVLELVHVLVEFVFPFCSRCHVSV